MTTLRVAMAQMNCHVGDIEGNTNAIISRIEEARAQHADIVVFPELAITGYPPEDLLLRAGFLDENLRALDRIRAATRGITAVVGYVDVGDDIYNAAAVLHDGALAGVHRKIFLPNYGVFDEDRYFRRGDDVSVFERAGVVFGVGVCEDLWYPEGPAHDQCLRGGAQVIININASPFHAGKWMQRDRMLSTRAADNNCFIVYTNCVGGQDELVFDGHSTIHEPGGSLLLRGPAFEEGLLVADLEVSKSFRTRLKDPRTRKERVTNETALPINHIVLATPPAAPRDPLPAAESAPPPGRWEEIYKALMMGVGDYVRKNRFRGVVIGLSGGIDSALAAIAVDALGPERVMGVAMPSVYSASESLRDAQALADNLGIRFLTVPIGEVFETFTRELTPHFEGRPVDVTEENLQARIRGNLLMALSNKFGLMVLTTGNMSEVATGYCTLYGDMCGGFSALKDVPKTWVFALSRYRNSVGPVIPEYTITRPPSAELRPDQRDDDSLPPYEVLDPILELYVELDTPFDEIVARGFDADTVRRVMRLVDLNEYKRRQAAPGVKITPRAFGKDRRMPITNAFRSG